MENNDWIDNIEDFVGMQIVDVNGFLKIKGWERVDVFNEYKDVWVNYALNKTIVAKFELTEYGDWPYNLEIHTIWSFDGIHSGR